MAFNESSHYGVQGTSSSTERDEFGCTERDYVRMMNDVAVAIVDGHDNRSAGQSLQAQPSPRERRRPTRQAEEDDVDDGEDSSEEEYDEEDFNMAKGTKKSTKASKATPKVNKGLTRMNADGELEWLATIHSERVLAVRHDDIRPQLIAIAEAERVALGVRMQHPDEPGPGKYNVTSFYRKHIHWGPHREHRPAILFDWEEDKERNPRPKCPGYMHWEENGKKYVVLDPHDNPVKDWDIPATIASNIPGYKTEAMRRENMSLGHKDFWARMPSQINFGTEDQPVCEELGHPNSIVNMPMERFRFHAGLCSWTERKKTLVIKAGLRKLYGNKLQNNSVRAFGRDLTNNEIKEIKKGDKAVFPILGDVAPGTSKAGRKPRSKGEAKPTKPKGNATVGKARSRKRKHSSDVDEDSSEEEIVTHMRSSKRARHGGKEDSIAAEVDDLVMFENSPNIIEQADSTRRYSLRSTRQKAKAARRTDIVEETTDQSSADEDYEDASKARGKSNGIEGSSRESSFERDDEETSASRFPFRRIARAEEVGGKSKWPSWVSSTGENVQTGEKRDFSHTAVPLNIGGRKHYATYEGLISNEPPYCASGSGSVLQRQAQGTINLPVLEQRNPEKEHAPLRGQRKRARQSLGEDVAESSARASKRLRTEQPALPLQELATHGTTSDVTPQTQVVPPPIVPPQANQPDSAPAAPHAQPPQTRQQKLDAEWSQVFNQTFLDLGFKSVNYSEVPPWNDSETQSLIDALLPTREIYLAWTGQPAPRTDPQQSYRAQFDTIFVAFQEWWREHRSDEDLPILAGVMHWGRSVDDWEAPCKDSIYYEAFRRGHRAPRDGNGLVVEMPNWPGDGLEDVYRKGR